MPFGFGKRVCVGEALAVHSLFIFFVELLQKLIIKKPIGKPPPNTDDWTVGMTRIPTPFWVSLMERNNKTCQKHVISTHKAETKYKI